MPCSIRGGAEPLAEANQLGVLSKGQGARAFNTLAERLAETSLALIAAQERASPWHDPLSAQDTQNAIEQARSFEQSVLRFLRSSYWRLRNTVRARYDFAQHAVAPTLVKILSDLSLQHEAQAAATAEREQAIREWQTDDVEGFCNLVFELRQDALAHPSVKALIRHKARAGDARPILESLGEIHETFLELDRALQFLLAEHRQFRLHELRTTLGQLRKQTGMLTELLPLLGEIASLPESFSHALRHAQVPLDEFEGAVAHKSLNWVYRQDRGLARFDGRMLERKMEQLEKDYCEWLCSMANVSRAAVRRKFLDHMSISSMPASQLDADQKAFKKTYAAGRREPSMSLARQCGTSRFATWRPTAPARSSRT